MSSRRARARSAVFRSGPWRAEDGDPSRPETVRGVPVAEHLGGDGRRALVRLVDERYALTGPTVVVGPARKLDRHLRRRARRGAGDPWFEEARQLLRHDHVRRGTPPAVGSTPAPDLHSAGA